MAPLLPAPELYNILGCSSSTQARNVVSNPSFNKTFEAIHERQAEIHTKRDGAASHVAKYAAIAGGVVVTVVFLIIVFVGFRNAKKDQKSKRYERQRR